MAKCIVVIFISSTLLHNLHHFISSLFNPILTMMSKGGGKKNILSEEKIKYLVLDSRWFYIRAENQTAAGRR